MILPGTPTPGPWHYDEARAEITTADDVAALIATVEIENASVAAQAHADGRLMAQAPAMRDALRDLLAWAELTGGWEAPCWEAARKLVEGETV